MSDPNQPIQTPPTQNQPQPYQGVPYPQPYGALPEHPQGTVILVLGIVGFFATICAPIAWYLGSKAQRRSPPAVSTIPTSRTSTSARSWGWS